MGERTMKVRILIVEDESIVQLDLRLRLERMGHVVVGVASRGEEAVAKANELKPDLVLMDVRLEGSMDGIEAARQIRASQEVPIVYVTAYGGDAMSTAHAEVLRPALSKPFRTAELQSAILREIVGKSQ